MPNYVYKAKDDGCKFCAEGFQITHPISEYLENCPECETEIRKVIGVCQFPKNVSYESAASWFKKTYGHELGERDVQYASEQKELDKQAAKLLREEGIKMNLKSRKAKGPE